MPGAPHLGFYDHNFSLTVEVGYFSPELNKSLEFALLRSPAACFSWAYFAIRVV